MKMKIKNALCGFIAELLIAAALIITPSARADDAYSWGSDGGSSGVNLGTGGSPSQSPVPVAVRTSGVLAGKTLVALAAAVSDNTPHAVVLDSDGKLYAWGNNSYGQLGDGSISPRNA